MLLLRELGIVTSEELGKYLTLQTSPEKIDFLFMLEIVLSAKL